MVRTILRICSGVSGGRVGLLGVAAESGGGVFGRSVLILDGLGDVRLLSRGDELFRNHVKLMTLGKGCNISRGVRRLSLLCLLHRKMGNQMRD